MLLPFCTNALRIWTFARKLELSYFPDSFSNFGTRMSRKGATEPGWRICTGCVMMKHIMRKINKSSFSEQRTKSNGVMQNDIGMVKPALVTPESWHTQKKRKSISGFTLSPLDFPNYILTLCKSQSKISTKNPSKMLPFYPDPCKFPVPCPDLHNFRSLHIFCSWEA